jgi:preprotein translocase subunit Sss1
MIAKVAAAGIIAIGLFGFFVYFVMDILPKMV